MSLNDIFTPETMRAHRATWWAYAGGQRIRAAATMRGTWGWDVTCSCGEFDSKTGGATRRSVEDALWNHRYSEQCKVETAAEMRAAGLDPDDPRQVINYLRSQS